ncbi:MAG: hypothetical protein A2600_11745 [Candidatus Lambdaproteobacteria bacterium RIFOXYD1_FULL_56_27]|uniref:Uncharacterized protein n=1 Tax=Candidatus Lambdaproteobacteria bacterium RIFOXYD2_FULL_56_26 TaxID=1817773 RepID=A0A1F6GX87_9PROT|nr:MAG: hypothetical protein A2557_02865 [Candidatus Lambdaproteobacteria bacterium RIFOXYD2_FULL_56_26]OGH08017.1 MAG: hypothetical protein A2600_11745 [Candidatus Lambdaproteobacteria bacterium RIFOXYD1_FULL_56_27]
MTEAQYQALAVQFGQEEAQMIKYLRGWILYNQTTGHNQVEGRTWTYDSLERIAERIEFWTVKQVRRILGSLRTQGVLQVGHFGKFWSDRTNWYAFVDEARFLGSLVAGVAQQAAAGLTGKPKPKSHFEAFAEEVAGIYNEVMASRGLKAQPENRKFRFKCAELKRQRPDLNLQQIRAGMVRLLEEANRDSGKASFLKWTSLLHPNVIGRAADACGAGPPVPATRSGPAEAMAGPPVEPVPITSPGFVEACAAEYNRVIAWPLVDPKNPVFADLCRRLREASSGISERILTGMIENALEWLDREWLSKMGPDEPRGWERVFEPEFMINLIEVSVEIEPKTDFLEGKEVK